MTEPGGAGVRLSELLAEAFVAEGVDTVFTLMGDGNMHWITTMAERHGVSVFHTRHEHCACTMAIGYYSATGKPGVASTTCGPGLTQIVTSLASAVRGKVPLVVFAGESPVNAAWHNQYIDQGPIVAAVGARYIRAHSPKLMPNYVREAFYMASSERVPVVLGVPYDLQAQIVPRLPVLPSRQVMPQMGPINPDPADVTTVAERLLHAERPIILAGRGAVRSGAAKALRYASELAGALLATTLPGRGLFDADPFSIGVAGGFASPTARTLFADADLVVAVGTSLSSHTTDGVHLFPDALVIQIDAQPSGLHQGRGTAELCMCADARLAAEAIARALRARPRQSAGYRTPEVGHRIASEIFGDGPDITGVTGELDPRRVVKTLDNVIPKDWHIVSGSGHSSYFYTHMRDRRPETFHVIREFGAIGNGLGIAIGVAATVRNGHVVLLEGDGGLLMHIQELETIQRNGLRLLVCCLNDGGFGAEIHKLRADGFTDSHAIFGRPDFASMARGFGLRGETVTDLERLPALFHAYESNDKAEIWNFPISRDVVSPRMHAFNSRKLHA